MNTHIPRLSLNGLSSSVLSVASDDLEASIENDLQLGGVGDPDSPSERMHRSFEHSDSDVSDTLPSLAIQMLIPIKQKHSWFSLIFYCCVCCCCPSVHSFENDVLDETIHNHAPTPR